jgi:hypothetical protein
MALTRRNAIGSLAAAGVPALLRGQSRRPNVIFLMTDVQRWDTMRTPNMHRLASAHSAPKARRIPTRDWKLIRYIQQPQAYEMLHLPPDPEDRKNLVQPAQHRHQFDKLKTRLEHLWAATDVTGGDHNTPATPCEKSDGASPPVTLPYED